MTNRRPLQGMKVIDLSHRLPGPLCGKILCDLGAEVIKVEDRKFKDPFLAGHFAQIDSSFLSWYENLNQGKQILHFDFQSDSDQEKIRQLIMESDAVIMGLPPKTRKKLRLTTEDLKLKRPMVVIELLASRHNKKSMHDLNALASTGLLSLYVANKKDTIVEPPFLPIAGISFGHKAATDLLAGFILALRTNETQFLATYLDEVTEELLGIFWPTKERLKGRTKFLHNGTYPCYSLYQTRDKNYVALAAIEEKFWRGFCEVFGIKTTLDRFHHSDNTLFALIANEMAKHTSAEIAEKIKNRDICLSVV